MSSNLSKDVDLILKGIHDEAFWVENELKIISLVSTNNNKAKIKEILRCKLEEGIKYSVLKLVGKLHLIFDDKIYLNYLKHSVNFNYNFYELIFDLHLKKLISHKGLGIIKYELLNHSKHGLNPEILENTETNKLQEKIEDDRQLAKYEIRKSIWKDNERFCTLKDNEYMNNIPLVRSDFINNKNFVFLEKKKVIIVDITDLFDLISAHDEYSHDIIRKLESAIIDVLRNFFKMPQGLSLETLSNNEIINSINNDIYRTNYTNYIKRYIEDFRRFCKPNFAREIIIKYDNLCGGFYRRFKELLQSLQHLNIHSMYFVTLNDIPFTLSCAAVFQFDCINCTRIISYSKISLENIISRINDAENIPYSVYYGNNKQALNIDECFVAGRMSDLFYESKISRCLYPNR
ncbi:hypothetical protein EDEG_01012 [Edhazardia aedis USNM 41457]|uniref:Uncharacterized protein n=1 Tax=Edhazardia aedis (strain USNM 41457) TaxID=1003232 RepID=J9DQF3_EDHAE|nr:hypothetical protein EDEG_01012 [Edhazardia aedis USNM 41457]|eukprot:EJW04790.1 hypothetical protein EDEG_01012 [Edhazardia aedis USNM 41457]